MIEIRKGGTLRTTWEELKINIKNNTSSLNIGDELDIVLKTGENVTLVCEYVGYKYATYSKTLIACMKTGAQTMKSVLVRWGLILANYSIYCQTIYKKL